MSIPTVSLISWLWNFCMWNIFVGPLIHLSPSRLLSISLPVCFPFLSSSFFVTPCLLEAAQVSMKWISIIKNMIMKPSIEHRINKSIKEKIEIYWKHKTQKGDSVAWALTIMAFIQLLQDFSKLIYKSPMKGWILKLYWSHWGKKINWNYFYPICSPKRCKNTWQMKRLLFIRSMYLSSRKPVFQTEKTSEAVARSVLKIVFLKISQNSQETLVSTRASFLIEL